MKKIKRLLLLVAVVVTAVLCFAFSASALDATGQCGDNVYWEYNSTTGELVISGEGAMWDFPYLSTGNYNYISPFSYSYVNSVVIENGVTTIGEGAFYHSNYLEKITISNSIIEIGSDAFSNCDMLKSVNIPSSVLEIGNGAFSSCKILETVILNYGLINIGERAFGWCDSLANIYIPESVVSIDKSAFYACYNLTSVAIPNGMTIINDSVFGWCSGLTSVIIPSSIIKIEDNAFVSCRKLANVYYIGTEEQWENIAFGNKNTYLITANIHFKYCLHSDNIVYAQENPTCTQIGYTEGEYCNICKRWISGHEEIPQIPHGYTKYTSDNNATVVSDGTKTAFCDYGCGNKNTVTDNGTKLTLGAPSDLKATQSTSSITLTWSMGNNATGYSIFYKLPSDMSWRQCVAYTTKTTHTFSKLPAGIAYNFAIRSVGKVDSVTVNGPYITISTATKAVAPAAVDSLQDNSAIRLTWTFCKGATGYRIYYKSGNTWKVCVSTTSATSHTFKNLKAGAKYTFAVRPYILTDSGVIWSDYTTVTTATKTVSPVVTLSSSSKGKINLSWKAVNGAEYYQVYYKVGNGNYKLYKTYTSVQKLAFSGLKSGTEYTFAVRGVIKGSESNIFGNHNPVKVTVK